jgi:hypothetical protein
MGDVRSEEYMVCEVHALHAEVFSGSINYQFSGSITCLLARVGWGCSSGHRVLYRM